MTEALSPEDIQARIGEATTKAAEPKQYTYIHPFSQAGDDLIDVITNSEGRWLFGVPELDAAIRGIGRGELMYVTGRAHSGKTQLVLQSVANYPQKRAILFTPDEVDVLILTKLIAMSRGISAEKLEKDISQGDEQALEMVRSVAADEFKNFVVVHDSLTFEQMSSALQEAEDFWGAPADVVLIDFLELLPGDADHNGVTWKSQTLKRWAKKHERPVICLHQSSRSSGDRGKSAGLSAMRYGGETEAIFVLEVFRKLEDKDLDPFELERHQNTLTVAVTKNKRPPGRKGEWDMFIHPECGQVRPLRFSDMPTPAGGMTAQDVLRAQGERQ